MSEGKFSSVNLCPVLKSNEKNNHTLLNTNRDNNVNIYMQVIPKNIWDGTLKLMKVRKYQDRLLCNTVNATY